jgi:hypothetical protein
LGGLFLCVEVDVFSMAHVPFDIAKIDILIGWERDLVRKFDDESYRELVQRES